MAPHIRVITPKKLIDCVKVPPWYSASRPHCTYDATTPFSRVGVEAEYTSIMARVRAG